MLGFVGVADDKLTGELLGELRVVFDVEADDSVDAPEA